MLAVRSLARAAPGRVTPGQMMPVRYCKTKPRSAVVPPPAPVPPAGGHSFALNAAATVAGVTAMSAWVVLRPTAMVSMLAGTGANLAVTWGVGAATYR